VAGGGSYDFFARLGCQQCIRDGDRGDAVGALPLRHSFRSGHRLRQQRQPTSSPVGQFVDAVRRQQRPVHPGRPDSAITSKLHADNARALARAQGSGQPATVVMPLVMYLGNSARAGRRPPVPVPSLAQEDDLPLSRQVHRLAQPRHLRHAVPADREHDRRR